MRWILKARAKARESQRDLRTRSGFPAPKFWAVIAERAEAREVTVSMAKMSYLLPIPTTAAA